MSSRNSSFPKGRRSNRSGASPGVQNSSSDYDSDSEDESPPEPRAKPSKVQSRPTRVREETKEKDEVSAEPTATRAAVIVPKPKGPFDLRNVMLNKMAWKEKDFYLFKVRTIAD